MVKYHRQTGFGVLMIMVLGLLLFSVITIVPQIAVFKGDIRSTASETLQKTVTYSFTSGGNEDGSSFSSTNLWIGNGQSTSSSYLGVKFTGNLIPQGATINAAHIEFTPTSNQWISVGSTFYAEKSNAPEDFSSSSKPSQRSLTSASSSYTDSVKWESGKTYSYDVKNSIIELVGGNSMNSVALIAKGTGSQWGRKFIYGAGSDKAPKLTISYTYSSNTVSTATPSPTATATARATATSQPTMPPMNPAGSGSSGATIFGLVSAELLGSCSQAVHDKHVATGPDGKVYRTWHPAKDSSGCTFAHEHGDDPATANNYSGKAVPFGYIAAQMTPPMDEPHTGFKCFVHNKGFRNDEGGVMQHDSYYCFHMGTGGAARFTARFHSLDMHVKTSTGAVMNLQGMADVGNVGTICDNPRQQRTVQGFGCLIDSAYEIWENRLFIRNKGTTLATAITSTAVFDPITSMDPADRSRLVYSWSEEAKQKIFKFGDDRSHYRGCEREAYSGPLSWYNQGGAQVYYTDVYGNVSDGGPLRQEISTVNNRGAGTLDKYGALIMAYKGGNTADPQAQFKFRKSACVAGLGIKN